MSYLISSIKLNEFDFSFKNYYLKINSEHYLIYRSDEEFLLVEGFLYDLTLKRKLLPEEVLNVIYKYKGSNEVFSENITGQFNIVHIDNDEIYLINDFTAVKPLYYCLNEAIYITNNINLFYEYDFKVDVVSYIQSFIGLTFAPLNNKSLFHCVNRLRNGEYINFNTTSRIKSTIIDKIDIQNSKIGNKELDSIISILKNNASIFKEVFKKLTLTLSGGVDSRIVLSSFENFDSNFTSVSYGEKEFIDNKIAKRTAEYIGISHQNISFKSSIFPSENQYADLLRFGKDYFVGCWFSVINFMKNDNTYSDTTVILGDLLDLLRNKNIKSLRTKSSRVKYQLKTVIGMKHDSVLLDIPVFVEQIQKSYIDKFMILRIKFPSLFSNLEFDESLFIERTKNDVKDYIEFLVEKTAPKNQMNLEEVFNIFSWGAGTMGTQTTVFKGDFESYSLLANRHVVKYLLSFSPLEKFEDTLTHRLLRHKSFNKFSHFPTAQIPFIAYNKNIYLKYFMWYMRNNVDQFLLKRGRKRLVSHIDWKDIYENSNNKTQLITLLEEVDNNLKSIPINIFDKRASGESWPLSEVDINVYIYLFRFISLQK